MNNTPKGPGLLRRYVPILSWGAAYSRQTFASDLVAALIVTIMLIPQALAYSLLVGLPPQYGLYASMGPVAMASLMTATAASQIAAAGTPEFVGAAIALAMISGLLLLVMGILRLGFLANFLSHPVISGFITAAAIQIAAGQLGPLLGIRTEGEELMHILVSLGRNLAQLNPWTAALGVIAIVFLLWARQGLRPLLLRMGLGERMGDILAKMGPAMIIVAATAAVAGLGLDEKGVKVLGAVPQGLPEIGLPPIEMGLWTKLLVPSFLICIVGYVERWLPNAASAWTLIRS